MGWQLGLTKRGYCRNMVTGCSNIEDLTKLAAMATVASPLGRYVTIPSYRRRLISLKGLPVRRRSQEEPHSNRPRGFDWVLTTERVSGLLESFGKAVCSFLHWLVFAALLLAVKGRHWAKVWIVTLGWSPNKYGLRHRTTHCCQHVGRQYIPLGGHHTSRIYVVSRR